ncbi:MAG: error-prone DNA polymerase [Rhodospirillaceae bacterium]|nr:error-prone DNA polymerase [Rhodospirillaceae bacterium]
MPGPAYAELACISNFSFLRGASHPEELIEQAHELGLKALALADINSFAGVVRAHQQARESGFAFIPAVRLELDDKAAVIALPTDRAAYGRLSRLITLGRRRAPKGECRLSFADMLAHGAGQIFIVLSLPPLEEKAAPDSVDADRLRALVESFPGSVYLAAWHRLQGDDRRRIAARATLASETGAPLVAVGDALYHTAGRRELHDLVTCIREHVVIDAAGHRLEPNAERHLKNPGEMARLFADHPEALAHSVEIAARCRFSLNELRYEYPRELTQEGRTPQQELEHLTALGARDRYPQGVPDKVAQTIRHELTLIGKLGYAAYFLTVHDLVAFAREKGILCQGRGSAANSAVCYCLGVTSIDPAHHDLLFERFVSAARNEPPDIDVDFEHERREEVIQHVYEKYGRDRAGLAATVICYRSRSAVRETGKAMGLSLDLVDRIAGQIWGWSEEGVAEARVRELGLDPKERRMAQTIARTRELIGTPRHLSQHVGGFVMTEGPLSELVPIENAAMEGRTVIEWDKDDLDALGMLKVDILALGMLTCLGKGFELIRRHWGKAFTLASVPEDDKEVYDMLCRADSIGVFQVESRAQMAMLPRLKPRNFYDLVIEVAIVRPGPIQGDMVHPYLRRRNREEVVSFPSKELENVLGKTLGVPLFQEQAMRIAIVAAGFTPDEADGLRRAMATFRHAGTIHTFKDKLIDGMVANNYEREFAERCFRQIEGFGDYGFPESHAASFALLVYVSAWMKWRYPAVFACALLNSQPLGFYAPAQIVRDAIEHGVLVREADVNRSDWDSTLEPESGAVGGYALRLGLRQIKGVNEAAAARLVAARGNGYDDPLALRRRAGLDSGVLERLARADAFRSIGLGRREALWAVKGLPAAPLPLFAAVGEADEGPEAPVLLPAASAGEDVSLDYATLRMTLRQHPMALLRPAIEERGYRQAVRLVGIGNDRRVRVAGIVLVRQRPGTASGVIFATLEDETGIANIVIWPKIFERFRPIMLGAKLLGVDGRLQREGRVIHVIADRLIDLSSDLVTLAAGGPVLPPALARADEVVRPGREPDYRSRDFH